MLNYLLFGKFLIFQKNLLEVLLDRVEAERIFVIDDGEFLWILHKVVDDALAVQVDNLVDLLIGLEVYGVRSISTFLRVYQVDKEVDVCIAVVALELYGLLELLDRALCQHYMTC